MIFSREQILDAYVAERKQNAATETAKNAAEIMYHEYHMEPETIAGIFKVTVETVQEWLGLTAAAE